LAYSIPDYLLAVGFEDARLRYRWDDWRASMDFTYDSSDIFGRLAGVSMHAKLAVGIGIYEWIAWRFRIVSEDPVPLQIAEAAWCANINRKYMEYVELPRSEWLGIVRGPLWCGITWLVPMVFSGDSDPEECESGLAYLPRLAMHVVPKPDLFEQWLDKAIERVIKFHSLAPEDPFEDLFSEHEEERRGPLVAREVLNPGFNYSPEMDTRLISYFLRSRDYQRNPFLHSPEQMLNDGFRGNPYVLTS
jgi:hypothetical protein